ncbi:MAG TPA: glycoside hydrolase family 31 protein, partial [Ohtaekwangia sp.]|nr:glycoside hydrolase family 31 protein [Ohtaekwangia sp.]
MMKNFWCLLLVCFVFGVAAAQTGPGFCNSFEKTGNRVVFNCANNAKVLVQICAPGILKIWYEPSGNFMRTNESFAVINEQIQEVGDVRVESQAQAYEIFTDKLRIRVNRSPFSLQVFDKYQRLLMGDYHDKGHLFDSTAVSAYKVLRADEQFFGLGEKSGSLNRRGGSYKMWNSDKPCYSASEDPLYKSIPFFMSSYRYGIFFDNTYKSEFKFGSDSPEHYSFGSAGGEMLYYFIYGNDYKEIISSYTKLTGNPIMPPDWAFGFSQSRGLLTNEALTREIAKGYRDRKIPCDIIYQDIGWTQWLQDFNWRNENYQNPRQMLRDLADDGFKVIVSQDPVVSQANHTQWKKADSLNYFVKDVLTGTSYDMPWPWGGNCGVVDFTNPAVADWWGSLQQKPLDDGVRGFWTDMGEPAWSNEESVDRLRMKHAAGMHDEVHNVYGFTWDKVVTEQFEKRNPERRVFQMTRAGYAGMQRYTFGWSGDAGNGNNILDGWSRLANQVQMGQSAGMGLIPFWSCDISGYCGDIVDYDAFSELYVRWMQFGVFNPISRAHHEGNNAVEPWLFGAGAERISRDAIELKYRLFPYLYTYGREAHETGIPLMRAMILEYPDDTEGMKAESQFLVGRELLVAPVVEKGAESKRVYLPEGEWISFGDTKTKYKGGQWIDFPVTLETIPLFVKAGSIIPTMPVMQYIGQDKNYPIILKVFPRNTGRSSFVLYEDDGTTNDYKKDIFGTTEMVCESGKAQIMLRITRKNVNGYKGHSRNFLIEVPATEKPDRVAMNGEKIKGGSL